MVVKKALHYFENGYNCSQAVLATYCEAVGLDHETASRIAVPFGGGLGRQGKLCGCVSGALMVIGLKHGNDTIGNNDSRIKNYDLANQFCQRFSEINGALDCMDIIKYNLNNLDERKKAQEENVFKTRCSAVVANTVELLEIFLTESSHTK